MAKPTEAPAASVESPELRHGQGVTALREGDVQVGGEDGGSGRVARLRLQAGHGRAGRCTGIVVPRERAEAADGHGAETGRRGILIVGGDIEVEVHADVLEEAVAERDEADFDGDLKVLHAPQLLQQVDDLLVDFLRLADDQAEVGLELGDRARSADLVPGGGGDGGVDQLDDAVEVGPSLRPVRRDRHSPARWTVVRSPRRWPRAIGPARPG